MSSLIKKRKKGPWPLILLVLGASLVALGVVHSHEDDDASLVNGGERSITAHNSSTPANPGMKAQDATGIPDNQAFNAQNAVQMPAAAPVHLPHHGKYYIIHSEPKFPEGTSAAAVAASQAIPYVVSPGDILGRIAQKHGCTIEELKIANRLANDQIKIGQKLLIPPCGTGVAIAPLIDEQAAQAAPEPGVQRGKWWKRTKVDTATLPKLMKAAGFKQPQHFMAFVLEITFDSTRQIITRERAFDWNGTSSKIDGWNPASSVKLFAAIGALHRIGGLGFTSRAKVTFHSKKPYTTTVSELIQSAIIDSNNIAYNRVVQLASFEELHQKILASKGMNSTALNRGYQLKDWQAMGENPSLRVSPAITLQEGKKVVKLPAQNSKINVPCASTACTTLQDLAESTRRLMLQEQLPPEESFNLQGNDLLMLRRAMRAERARGNEMVNAFESVFKSGRIKYYRKPGFSEDWFTDNIYIFDPDHNQAWIVVMSGYPGRNSLDSAALAIARIISKGQLRDIP